jgi:tetratricopeptide (TPR) repeat protein
MFASGLAGASFSSPQNLEQPMTLIQELMNQAAVGGLLNPTAIKRFTPAEIRETIQQLVATEQLELANALGDAGLSLYPQSEDILAITGLLAMMNQDWQLAVELIDELVQIQGENTPAFTFVMLVRALRCNLEPERALDVARHGLRLYPQQVELLAEKLSLDDFSDAMHPAASMTQ